MFITLKKRFINEAGELNVLAESLAIVALFVLSVVVVYLSPKGFDRIFFGLTFVFFWFSKRNYFWFAFYIIIFLTPGGFFVESSAEATRRIPIFTLFPKASFSVFDIFLIVALFKAIFKGVSRRYKDVFNYKLMLAVVVGLFLISFYHEMSVNTFFNRTLRGTFYYTLAYSFPALIFKKKDLYKFMYLFFPFVFFEIFTQIYLLQTGVDFITNFNPELTLTAGREDELIGGLRLVANGYVIVISSFIFSFVFLDNPERLSPRSYILAVTAISALSILLSATRQSIIMIGFMFVLYFLLTGKRKSGYVIQFSFVLLILFLLIDFADVFDLNKMIKGSFNRLTGAVVVEGGEIVAENSLAYRLEYRLPKLMAAFEENPFLGYGFSDKFYEVYDGHLGGVIVGLLQAGIIGYIFYIYFIIRLFRVIIFYQRKFRKRKISYSEPLKVMVIGLTGYLLVNAVIEPVFIYNISYRPQGFFLLVLLSYVFIHNGIDEYKLKKQTLIKLSNRKQALTETATTINSK
jgi:hypothetical protein